MKQDIILRVSDNGTIHCVHTEALPLNALGHLSMTRASVVEFNPDDQLWEVRFMGSKDPVFAHPDRSACITWEVGQLNHRLASGEPVMPRRAGGY